MEKLQNDPENRKWAITRSAHFIDALREVGVKLPEITQVHDETASISAFPLDPKGTQVEWSVRSPDISVGLSGDGDLEHLTFSASASSYEHFERAEKDASYARFLEDADQLSTESMRVTNELILKTLKPDDWSNYRMWRESINRHPWKQGRGMSSDQFEGAYIFEGQIYGLPCDGKSVRILYDRISGTLRSIGISEFGSGFPLPNEIKIHMSQAKELAENYLRDRYFSAKYTVVSCGKTKMTFARIGGAKKSVEWDLTQPRIAHQIRVHWRPRSLDGWYTDDVTVDAISGELLDITHYGSIRVPADPPPVPREHCADLH